MAEVESALATESRAIDKGASDRRSLGVWRCWGLVVGGTIGSAVFMMPAVMAPYGGIGVISLATATVGALFVAMMFGTLASRVTATGGMYAYTREGVGDFAAFLVAWSSWISLWVSCAALAIGFVAYLGVVAPEIASNPILGMASGLILIWVLVGVNIAGVRESGIITLVTTILKLTPLVLVGVVGLWFIDADNLPAMHPGEGSALMVFVSIFALSFWNFVGIETATVPAEDTVDPTRTIPRALLTGTLTVGAVYLLVSIVTMGVLPAGVLIASSSPVADVGTKLLGGVGGALVVAGAIVSTAGTLNAAILEGGQIVMAAARDQLFPRFLSRLSRNHTPWISYVLMGAFASLLLMLNFSRGLVAAYTFVLLISTLTIIIPYAFSAIAGLVLQQRNPVAHRAGRWRETAVAAIALGICIWVMAVSGIATMYWVLLLLGVGLPVYAFARWRIRPLTARS